MDSIVSEIRIQGSGLVTSSPTKARQEFSIGSAPMPSMDVAFTYGTGDNQVNLWWWAKNIDPETGQNSNVITLESGATHSWDLDELLDFEGNEISFDFVKLIILAVVDPDGKRSLRFGPQGVSGAHQLWFNDTDAWEEVFTSIIKSRPVRGWDINSEFGSESGKELCVSNPTGVGTADDAIRYTLLVMGIKVDGDQGEGE